MTTPRVFMSSLVVLLSACTKPEGYTPVVDGDPERGRAALREYECNACHVIPGVAGPQSLVGPSLDAFARRVYVAGKFPNTPDYLVPWIIDAPSMAPQTAMPAMSMQESQARDIAAYLYSLH